MLTITPQILSTNMGSIIDKTYLLDLHTKFLDADDSLNPNPCQWAGEGGGSSGAGTRGRASLSEREQHLIGRALTLIDTGDQATFPKDFLNRMSDVMTTHGPAHGHDLDPAMVGRAAQNAARPTQRRRRRGRRTGGARQVVVAPRAPGERRAEAHPSPGGARAQRRGSQRCCAAGWRS